MKIYLMVIVAILLIQGLVHNANAQNNTWIYINSYKGVSVYWRYRQELKNQYISEMKFENNNGYKVEVDVTPAFICADGTEEKEPPMLFTIRPYDKQAGQFSGFWWYPCDGTRPPYKGGYLRITVERVN